VVRRRAVSFNSQTQVILVSSFLWKVSKSLFNFENLEIISETFFVALLCRMIVGHSTCFNHGTITISLNQKSTKGFGNPQFFPSEIRHVLR